MYITGGRISVRHPARHRGVSRPAMFGLQAYLATTARILRQLAGDHRSMAMIMLVPTLVITLMYFMFAEVPHPRVRRRRSTTRA